MPQVWWHDKPEREETEGRSTTLGSPESDAAFVERLTEELTEEIRQYRRWRFRQRIRRLIRLMVIGAIVYSFFKWNWGTFVWFMVIAGGSEMTDRRASRRRQAATLLARTQDPRAVNVLAHALISNDPATRAVASKALLRILPTLKASDSRYITPEGLRTLTSLLRANRFAQYDLVLAILEALKQVGTPACIPAVERLLSVPYSVRLIVALADRWHYAAPRRKVEQVQEAARECLEILRLREKEERDRATLLRPAERPPDETLLRPVEARRPMDDLTLVRPVGADGDGQTEGSAAVKDHRQPDEAPQPGVRREDVPLEGGRT